MDEFMFKQVLEKCRCVVEETRYFEILNFSDPFYNTCEEHPLPDDEFENFVCREGAFAPPNVRPGVRCLSGIRLIVQQDAKVKETFSPHVLSLTKEAYESMTRHMRLPLRAIEGTSIVGPFFWAALDTDPDPDPTAADNSHADEHFQIIYRKSDVKKRGKTRGWEMMLSHSFRTGITSGYIKGTPNAEIKRALTHLGKCAHQVAHPMLLPVIVLSYDLASSNDERQRAARDWLRQLENAVTMREEIETNESYFQNDVLDLDAVSRDLVECHSQVLWKRPQAYLALIREMVAALRTIRGMTRVPPVPPVPQSPLLQPPPTSGSAASSGTGLPLGLQAPPRSPRLEALNGSNLDGKRLNGNNINGNSLNGNSNMGKLNGGDAGSMVSRRSSFRSACNGTGEEGSDPPPTHEVLVAQRRQWVEFERLHRSMLARFDFYRLKLTGTEHYAHTSLERLKIQREALYNILAQRESRINLYIAGEQKRLALASKRDGTSMKAISLLGALFLPGTYLASVFSMDFFNFQTADRVISPTLWVYFVIAVPVTAAIVLGWITYDRRREIKFRSEDEHLEKDIEQMGHEFMATMRKRTLSKANTFNTAIPPPR